LVTMENTTASQAEEWLRHYFDKRCSKKIGTCPQCSGELLTWRARWCPHCNHSWFPSDGE
jgi:hypothetical protein